MTNVEKEKRKQKIIRWVKIILIIYTVTGFGFYFFQEKILFQSQLSGLKQF